MPQTVTSLAEAMIRAGLLQAVESIFSLELLTDQLYSNHAAAVDSSVMCE